jgi:hypothetical protein
MKNEQEKGAPTKPTPLSKFTNEELLHPKIAVAESAEWTPLECSANL